MCKRCLLLSFACCSSELFNKSQVRVYTVGDLGADCSACDSPRQPVAVHRLPSKMSSIAWCPDSEVRNINEGG